MTESLMTSDQTRIRFRSCWQCDCPSGSYPVYHATLGELYFDLAIFALISHYLPYISSFSHIFSSYVSPVQISLLASNTFPDTLAR